MTTIQLSRVWRGGQADLQHNTDGSYACTEGDTIRIDICNSEELASVLVEGFRYPVQTVGHGEPGFHFRCDIPIFTWAGRARVEVECEDRNTTLELDVAPHAGKLGADAFEDMLRELETISRGLPWGLSPGHVKALVDRQSPQIVQPAALERLLPKLKGALSGLYQDPLLRSITRREVRPLTMARRVDRGTVRWVGRRPAVVAALQSGFANMAGQDPRLTAEQPVIHTSYDHPATRYIVGLLHKLAKQLKASEDHLLIVAEGNAEGRNNDFVCSYAEILADTVRQVHGEILDVLDARPFRSIRPGPMTETVVQALGDHPAYRRVHSIARQMLEPGLQRSEGGDSRGSLRETWDLFELLVLFRLGSSLACEFSPGWTWSAIEMVDNGLTKGPGNGFVISAKNANGWEIRIHYQRTFSGLSKPVMEHGARSLSRERRPDYAIGIFHERRLKSWSVLDAKYRSSLDPIRDGLADLHVYRDGLRWDGLPCSSAWIVVPKLSQEAQLYGQRAYRHLFKFGALAIQESEWADDVVDWIRSALSV